jgi:Transcriptional regulators
MQQNPTGESYEFYLRAIVQAMKQSLDNKLLPYNITSQQARLLGYLDSCLAREEEPVQKDLERAMRLRGPSVTSLLQGLERKDFITRSTGSEDGRTKLTGITAKGRALIDEVEGAFAELEVKLVRGMSAGERETFLRLLEQSYRNMQT